MTRARSSVGCRAACAAILLAVLALAPSPGRANDSTGFMGTHGLELARTDAIRMVSEDLFIGPERIAVDYVFRNVTAAPVSTLVIFPFPPVDMSMTPTAANWAFPAGGREFLGFETVVDGRPVPTSLERRAFFRGEEVTDVLRAAGLLDFSPWADASGNPSAYERVAAGLPPAVVADLVRRGLLGEGEVSETDPQWTLALKAWWTQVFPPGRDVRVRHVYRPFVGTALVEDPGAVDGRQPVGRFLEEVRPDDDRYCIDPPTRRGLQAMRRQAPTGVFTAMEIAYVLTTGANWHGPIGRFRMTLDKGRPENILSLCWSGLRRTGPTRFEFEARDWTPDRDVRLLILAR
jgi:hypothetical protein